MNEFAALREIKVILKEIKGKVDLEESVGMEALIHEYQLKNGDISDEKVIDFPKDAYKKDEKIEKHEEL